MGELSVLPLPVCPVMPNAFSRRSGQIGNRIDRILRNALPVTSLQRPVPRNNQKGGLVHPALLLWRFSIIRRQALTLLNLALPIPPFPN